MNPGSTLLGPRSALLSFLGGDSTEKRGILIPTSLDSHDYILSLGRSAPQPGHSEKCAGVHERPPRLVGAFKAKQT